MTTASNAPKSRPLHPEKIGALSASIWSHAASESRTFYSVTFKKYRDWIAIRPELLAQLSELRGKTLGCYCKPEACHGDVLADLADKKIS
jgi:hypothetical protein